MQENWFSYWGIEYHHSFEFYCLSQDLSTSGLHSFVCFQCFQIFLFLEDCFSNFPTALQNSKHESYYRICYFICPLTTILILDFDVKPSFCPKWGCYSFRKSAWQEKRAKRGWKINQFFCPINIQYVPRDVENLMSVKNWVHICQKNHKSCF